MKSPLERVRELNEMIQDYPYVASMVGAILELADKFHSLDQKKQDKPEITAVNPNELTRGNLQAKLHRLLSTAGDNEREIALKVFCLLGSLE